MKKSEYDHEMMRRELWCKVAINADVGRVGQADMALAAFDDKFKPIHLDLVKYPSFTRYKLEKNEIT